MRIIGKVNDDVYLAQVSHTELEKAADLYYGKMPKLRVGVTMDLAAGHDFRSEIKEACRSMLEAYKQFDRAQQTLLAFARMVGDLPEPAESSGAALEKENSND
jgi:hypothetical protein